MEDFRLVVCGLYILAALLLEGTQVDGQRGRYRPRLEDPESFCPAGFTAVPSCVPNESIGQMAETGRNFYRGSGWGYVPYSIPHFPPPPNYGYSPQSHSYYDRNYGGHYGRPGHHKDTYIGK